MKINTLIAEITIVASWMVPTGDAFLSNGEVYPPFTTTNKTWKAAFTSGVNSYTMFNFYANCPKVFGSLWLESHHPMAAWGLANCHDHALWGEQFQMLGWEAISNATTATATSLDFPLSKQEQLYINSTMYLFNPNISSLAARRSLHEQILRTIVTNYPADGFAKLMLSMSLLAKADPALYGYVGIPTVEETLECRALISQVLRDHPESAFAHHMWIHATDMQPTAQSSSSLRSAKVIASLRPEEAHAQHMPSHTYVRLGDFDKCSEANVAALEVAPHDQHAQQVLVYCYLNLGRRWDAEQIMEPLYQEQKDDVIWWSRIRWYFMVGNYILFYKEAPSFVDFEELARIPLPAEAPDQSLENFWVAVWATKSYASALFAYGYLSLLQDDDNDNLQVYWDCHNALQDLGAKLHAQYHLGGLDQDFQRGLLAYRLLPSLVNKDGQELISIAIPDTPLGGESAAWNSSTVSSTKSLPALELASFLAHNRVNGEGYGYPFFPSQFPWHEMYGELLLQEGLHEQSLHSFQNSLLQYPNRLPSLLGAFDAALQSNQHILARQYLSTLQSQLANQDGDSVNTSLEELSEQLELATTSGELVEAAIVQKSSKEKVAKPRVEDPSSSSPGTVGGKWLALFPAATTLLILAC